MQGEAGCSNRKSPSVSIILPLYNAESYLEECLNSILAQTFPGCLEISVFSDGCTDKSLNIVQSFEAALNQKHITLTLSGHTDITPHGVGYAKNKAVLQSKGEYLCFMDADDIAHPERISEQLTECKKRIDGIVGSQFRRLPDGSTQRYTYWANTLPLDKLTTQIYTSHGPTVIMPTWFCHRRVFDKVGGFDESGTGTPEDYIFFLKHLHLGGTVHRVDKVLLMYRYHASAATFSVKEDTIWDIRVHALEKNILSKWETFTIWNAGKQGRRLYRSLSQVNKNKVIALCDVDKKKVAKGIYTDEESSAKPKRTIPICHFSAAKPPFILCVKLDLTNGEFEKNLASVGGNLEEGLDFVHFS